MAYSSSPENAVITSVAQGPARVLGAVPFVNQSVCKVGLAHYFTTGPLSPLRTDRLQ
jgi:hypothetical protein